MAAFGVLAGCGGSRTLTVTRVTTETVSKPSPVPKVRAGELLSVPAVGRIYARCDPSKGHWTMTFLNDALASDSVTYRIGTQPARRSVVNPGQAVAWTLLPGRYTSREPADKLSGFPAAAIRTTEPVSLDVSQGTEPHIYRVKMRLALAAAIGDTVNCALISSNMVAATYYPGGQPPS